VERHKGRQRGEASRHRRRFTVNSHSRWHGRSHRPRTAPSVRPAVQTPAITTEPTTARGRRDEGHDPSAARLGEVLVGACATMVVYTRHHLPPDWTEPTAASEHHSIGDCRIARYSGALCSAFAVRSCTQYAVKITKQEVVNVIRCKAALPAAHGRGSIVFARLRLRAPSTRRSVMYNRQYSECRK